jgi:hypothetical protein
VFRARRLDAPLCAWDGHSDAHRLHAPTEPLLVVDIDADACLEHDRSRHPRAILPGNWTDRAVLLRDSI